MTTNTIKINNTILITLYLFTFINILSSTQISLGNLTILTHPQQSQLNKSITLTPMAYQQHLPNLQIMKIRIVKADPFDACKPLSTSKIFPLQDDVAYPDTFVLVDGKIGECQYWRKAEMAKQAMVKGVIIIDDDHQKNSNQAYDYNNGQFYSFLITPEESSILITAEDKQIQAKLKIYQSQAPKQKKNVYIWLSSLNAQSYDYISWWNQTLTNLPQLKDKIVWEPKYVFYSRESVQNKEVYSCACNGLFCSPEYHGKTSQVLIKQDLRQKLIFQLYPNQFLTYIQLFTERCLPGYLKDMFVQECAKTQMISCQINDTRINKQIENFIYQCDKSTDLFGKLLTDKGRFSMIGSYPVILLNRQILQFSNQNELQAVFCRRFSLQQSEGCIQYYHTTIQQIIVSIVFFLFILLGLFGVGFFVVMCYKNRLRKEMHKEVKMQVSTAVQHYFQLSQEHSNRKK